MLGKVRVSALRFTPASPNPRGVGVIGWASFVLGDALQLDGFVVRRTASGRVRAFFPERVDQHGRKHAFVWPLRARDRDAIEQQILDELARQGVST